MNCTTISPRHHQTRRAPRHDIEDQRPSDCHIHVERWVLPLPAGAANYGFKDIGFIPHSVSVRNYSNQALYLATSIVDAQASILNMPELIIPSRVVYNAPFGIRSFDKSFAWNLPGDSYGNAAIILAYFYECEDFAGDSIYPLPPDLAPNAIESYEKSTTLAGLTPGGTIATGVTDSYTLNHASVDVTVAADTQPMQFTTGSDATHITNQFTLLPGEKLSLGSRVGFVKVKNIGAADGGYRILNLYQSQTL